MTLQVTCEVGPICLPEVDVRALSADDVEVVLVKRVNEGDEDWKMVGIQGR